MKIHFERSGGFAGLTLHTVVDSTDLHPAAARELATLVDQSGLAMASGHRTVNRTADAFSYSLTIDDDGRCSAFASDETSLPDAARPLVDWLTRRAQR
jgi:hypothetical protein